MSISTVHDIESFLSQRSLLLDALVNSPDVTPSPEAMSLLQEENTLFASINTSKQKYASLLSTSDTPLSVQFSCAESCLLKHAKDEFCGGQKMAECTIAGDASTSCGDMKNFKIPLWKKEQEKTCFLPDVFKLARASECRVIVLLDGDRHWSEEGMNDSRQYLTLNDTSIDSSVESECSDRGGKCVLTWLRVYQPGERIEIDTEAVMSGEEGIQQNHDGKVFDSMQEEHAYGGYRCAVLRVGSESWEAGKRPEHGVWPALEALFNRGFSEARAAYGCSNVMLVDVCAPSVDESDCYWGFGDRAATLMAIDACTRTVEATRICHGDNRSDFSGSSDGVSMANPVLPPLPPLKEDTVCNNIDGGDGNDNGDGNNNGDGGGEKVSRITSSDGSVVDGEGGSQGTDRSLADLMAMARNILQSSEGGKVEGSYVENESTKAEEVDDGGTATELLLKCAENSDILQREYLAKQKQLSSLKLAARLKKRREEKEKKAAEVTLDASAHSSNNRSSSKDSCEINPSRVVFQLLALSRHLHVSLDQRLFIGEAIVRRAREVQRR